MDESALDVDQQLIQRILSQCIQKKRSKKFRERSDVILKTIFRSFRKYFSYKFDSMMNFKKIKRRVSFKNNFIDLIEEFVQTEIPPKERLGFNCEVLTNYLTALIHPKELPKSKKSDNIPKNEEMESNGFSNLERQQLIERLSDQT